jgi:lipoate-protein ligase A
MRWRWLASAPASGAEQMAVVAALLARARDTGEATLRVYAWARPTLSFGRHETVLGRFSADTLSERGYDAVRRPTGGRTLLHDGEVTYSVTQPAGDGESVHEAFTRINRLLAAALASLGVQVAEAPRHRALRPGRDLCFAEPSEGELTFAGRKLVASAQRRESGALLQHGSILLSDRQGDLMALGAAPMTPPAPGATLEDALGRTVSWREVGDALRLTLAEQVDGVEPLGTEEVAALAAPLISRYADPQWTWRR